nr:S-layer homology domain-containing protein [Lysinibacillus timonensis]
MYKKILASFVCVVGLSIATGASAATVSEEELNDSFAMANSIKIGDTITGELTKLESDIDEDFYMINVPQDGKLTIKASMLQHLKDHTGHEALQLQLFASSGDGITLYELESGSDTFPFYLAKGTYYLRVFSNDQPMKYSLATSFVSGDSYENESNNTQATAKPLIPNSKYTGTLNDGGYDNTFQDVDYYKFEMSEDGLFELEYTPSTRIANHFVIEKANGGEIHHPNSNANNWTEPVNIRLNLEKGVYYLKIEDNTSGYNVREYSIEAKFPTNKFNPVEAFKDVPPSHPYYEQISFMKQRSIISGYEDNTFKPGNSIARMHVATILKNAGVELTPIRPATTFKDVPKSHPYYDSIQALYRAGIVDGSNGYFNPDQSLTRSQLAVILVKAFDLKQQSGSSKPFTDVIEGDWYFESVKILASNNITKGSNGKFNPYQHVTRQQFAVFLYEILK